MSNQDYTATISVDQSPNEAFEAIKNIHNWGPEEIEESTAKVGDDFHYHYQDVHKGTMKLVELVPNKKVALLVTVTYFNFTDDNSQWKGTTLVFAIARKGR